ncbi:Hypothetical protein PBC10988_32630 [Planctomycetales bacterium 10988]|nr:Hypothetical protein PBC10988_32630 [Planctomycetales bacterium 10988]
MRRFERLVVPLCWLFSLVAGLLPAQESPESSSLKGPLEFRRIYLPADRVEDWPLGKMKFRPTDREEFEQLVKELQAVSNGPELQETHIVRAAYSARLEGQSLIDGNFSWQIHQPQSTPSLLPLKNFHLPIHNAHWSKPEEATSYLGLHPEGYQALVVPKSGTLEAEWSMTGERRTSSDSLEFSFSIPEAQTTILLLDVPQTWTLDADKGVVLGPLNSDLLDHRRWRLELSGHRQFEVRMRLDPQATQQQGLTHTKQTLTYDFSQRGLEVSCQLEVESLNQPRQQIELHLDPSLRLIAARYDDESLEWLPLSTEPIAEQTEEETANSQPTPTRVLLQLPEPISGGSHLISLKALAPLQLDQPWRLPRIRPADLFWREGQSTLRVPAPLVLEQVKPVEIQGQLSCRQIEASPLPSPNEGESIVMQHYTSEAAVEVIISRLPRRLAMEGGISLLWKPDIVQGKAVLDLSLDEGKRFELTLDCPRVWVIDTVRTVPAEALGTWSYRSEGPMPGKVKLELAKALSTTQPIRVILQGRWLRPPFEKQVSINELAMVHCEDASQSFRRLALQSVEPYRVLLSNNEGLDRITAEMLSSTWTERLSVGQEAILLELGPEGTAAQASLQQGSTDFQTATEMTVEATPNSFCEQIELTTTVEPARHLQSMQVFLSGSAEQAIEWKLVEAQRPTRFEAKVIRPPSSASAEEVEGTWWEFTFSPPCQGKFLIEAMQESRWESDHHRMSLPFIAEASQQTLQIQTTCYGDPPPQFETRDLVAVPHPSKSRFHSSLTRAAFRYESTDQNLASLPELSLSRASSKFPLRSGVIWKQRRAMRLQENGDTSHLASWAIQQSGLSTIQWTFPPTTDDLQVWLDDELIPVQTELKSERKVMTLAVPKDSVFFRVTAAFTTNGMPLSSLTNVEPSPIEVSLPILEREEAVALPSRFQILESPTGWNSPQLPPLSISQRLLGPLGRPTNASPAPLFSVDYWSNYWQPSNDRREAVEVVFDLRDELKSTFRNRTIEITWGDWLANVLEEPSFASLSIWIDEGAFAKEGIFPEAILPQKSKALLESDATDSDAYQSFDPSLFAYILTPHQLILTTQDGLEPWRALTTETVSEGIVWCEDVSERCPADWEIKLLEYQWQVSAFTPWQRWVLAPNYWEQENRPWKEEIAQLNPWGEGSEWYLFESPSSTTIQLQLFETSALWGYQFAGFLLSFWLASLLTMRRMPAQCCLLGAFAMAALLVPQTYSGLCSALIGGILIYWFWTFLSPEPRDFQNLYPDFFDELSQGSKSQSPSHSRGKSSRRSVTTGLILLVLVACVGKLIAQSEPIVYPVFIAVDQDRNPVPDEKYQVPVELYQRMQAAAERLRSKPQGWLFHRARYEASLIWEPLNERFQFSRLDATFDLQVFDGNRLIQLDIGEGCEFPRPSWGRLNGRQVPIRWTAQGDRCEIMVTSPGDYQFELVLDPEVYRFDDVSGIEMELPMIADSRFRLQRSHESMEVEFPSALGKVRFEDTSQEWQVDLGPVSRLTAYWQEDRPAPMPRRVSLEQLLWLRVLPGSAVLSTQLQYRVEQGDLHKITLATDSRLRLLRWEDLDPQQSARIRDLGGNPRQYEITFSEPRSGTFTVQATFLMEGTSGVGNLRLPRIEPQEGTLQRQWMAVSIDRSLEVIRNEGEEISTENFLLSWVGMPLEAEVWRVFDVGDFRSVLWNFTTRPLASQKAGKQSLLLSTRPRRLDVLFQVDLQIGSAPSFQHQIKAPANLLVESIHCEQAGVGTNVRWSQDPQGTLTVMLKSPTLGQQRVLVKGWIPISEVDSMELPWLQIENTTLENASILVYRNPGMQVEWEHPPEVEPIAGQYPSRQTEDLGQLVEAYRVLPALLAEQQPLQPSGKLKFTPSKPRIDAIQQTTLLRVEGRWWVEIQLSLQNVEGGVVDMLRFLIPEGMQDGWTITPKVPFELVPVGNRDQFELQLHPRELLSQAYEIRLRAPLPASSAYRVALPRILPRRIQNLDHYIVLPTQFELQNAEWSVHGMVEQPLPSRFETPPPNSYTSYRVINKRYRARLETVAQTSLLPRVRLAQHTQRWDLNRTLTSLSTFLIEPAGKAGGWFALPEGLELLGVQINGHPARILQHQPASKESPNRWLLDWEPAQYPFICEILTRQPGMVENPSQVVLGLPAFEQLPVEKSLWSLHGVPPSWSPGLQKAELQQLGTLRTEQDFVQTQLEALSELTELAFRIQANEPSEEFQHWFAHWETYLQSAKKEFAMLLPPKDTANFEVSRQDWEGFSQQLDHWQKQLPSGRASLIQRSIPHWQQVFVGNLAPSGPSTSTHSENLPLLTEARIFRASWRGAVPPLAITRQTFADGIWGLRGMLAVIAGLLGLVVAGWFASGKAQGRLLQSPSTFFVIGGMLWWLFLEPSLLGWVGVVIGVCLIFRSPWKMERPSRSTIMHLKAIGQPPG